MKNFYPKKASKSTYQMSFFQLFFQNSVITPYMRISKNKQKNAIFFTNHPLYEDFFPRKKHQIDEKVKNFGKNSKIENS